MGSKSRVLVKRIALAFLVALAIGATASSAAAAVGSLLSTVSIPTDAQCFAGEGYDSGTAVAVVPGSKVGYPNIATLLVTSCVRRFFSGEFTSFQTVLSYLNPANVDDGGNAELVATLLLSDSAPAFQSLVLRPDQGDLLGCSAGEGTEIYAIHFSIFDPVGAGNVSFMRTAPSGATCDGIAWDPSDRSIYQSSSGPNVLHYLPTGTGALPGVPHGCSSFVTGVQVAGVSLFVACPGDGEDPPSVIRQISKANGTLVTSFAFTAPDQLGDLEYDSTTFAAQGKDALWTKDQFSDQLYAAEVALGTNAQTSGTPVALPGACPAGYATNPDGSPKDTDGDGLLDCWEDGALWTDGLPGISFAGTYGNPTLRDVTLCVDTNNSNGFGAAGSAERATECASPFVKDVFLEIDYMQFHKPDAGAVNNVVTAFLNAPVSNGAGNPTGIRLHVQIGEQIAHKARLALFPCTGPFNPADADSADFDQLKPAWFGTAAERTNAAAPTLGNKLNAKRLAFHYAIFGHNLAPQPPATTNTSSGCAEVPGNDFVVTLGSFGGTAAGHTGGVGTPAQQAGTLMHEFGHNLGLRHGGRDNLNCKPNYVSVMNYSYQFPSPATTRLLDYSRQTLSTLNEQHLNETLPLVALPGEPPYTGQITFGPPTGVPAKPTVVQASPTTPINWNRNASTDPDTKADINVLTSVGCAAVTGGNADVLAGFNDWANIQLNFRATADFADGGHITIDPAALDGTLDMGIEEARELSLDRDGDGVLDIDDDCPGTPGTGTACTVKVKLLGVLLSGTRPGHLGIAILGGAGRDARKIDPDSVVLHGEEVHGNGIWALRVKEKSGTPRCAIRDVTLDKRVDLVCELEVTQGQLPRDLSKVTLEATTTDGETLQGFASLFVLRIGSVDLITGF